MKRMEWQTENGGFDAGEPSGWAGAKAAVGCTPSGRRLSSQGEPGGRNEAEADVGCTPSGRRLSSQGEPNGWAGAEADVSCTPSGRRLSSQGEPGGRNEAEADVGCTPSGGRLSPQGEPGGRAGAETLEEGAPGEQSPGKRALGGERPGGEKPADRPDAVTREELSQLSFLQREIEGQRQRIRELRNTLKSPTMSGMPRGGGVSNPVARTVELIQIQEKLLLEGVERCLKEQNRLLAFVQSVEDSRMRQILRYRHVDGLSWVKVAHRMSVTPESVKMAYKRFFDGREGVQP